MLAHKKTEPPSIFSMSYELFNIFGILLGQFVFRSPCCNLNWNMAKWYNNYSHRNIEEIQQNRKPKLFPIPMNNSYERSPEKKLLPLLSAKVKEQFENHFELCLVSIFFVNCYWHLLHRSFSIKCLWRTMESVFSVCVFLLLFFQLLFTHFAQQTNTFTRTGTETET